MPQETTIETLLEKINELETKITTLEEANNKLKVDNDEIKAFNRQLLNRPGKKVEQGGNDDKAKELMDKYLKGE